MRCSFPEERRRVGGARREKTGEKKIYSLTLTGQISRKKKEENHTQMEGEKPRS